MKLDIVILAGGAGKRMHSAMPKVLHRIGGKTLLEHVVQAAHGFSPGTRPIVVEGYKGELVRNTLSHLAVEWVHQDEQLGTGHAVLQTLEKLNNKTRVLVLCGDVPLISPATLRELLAATAETDVGLLTTLLPEPDGFGRIIRDKTRKILRIVEEKDASPTELAINEINAGIYLIPVKYLKKWLPTLSSNNAQKEYYLTDIIKIAIRENIAIQDVIVQQPEEVLGVNTREQLAGLESIYQERQAQKFMRAGVTLFDPTRFDIRGDVQIGEDTVIDVNVILEGKVKIGKNCSIGPHCILRNTTIADDVEIRAFSYIDEATIASHCVIGPFARLRPGTVLAKKSHVGNFVEIKNSVIGIESKISHLSYVGDSEIGERVNIGAGTITCNYDGQHKNKTIIGDNAFIGSNTALVAPVTIHADATIGAGSTITHDAPAGQLTLARTQQKTIGPWRSRAIVKKSGKQE